MQSQKSQLEKGKKGDPPMERKSFLIVAKEIVADKSLSATEKLLYAQLLDHRNRRTGQCNPKHATLARELGICERTVERSIQQLRDQGWITMRRGQNGCRYEIPTRQNVGSHPTNPGVPTRQNVGSEAPVSFNEPYLMNSSGVAAASSKRKSFNAPPPPRKSAQSETLEAYYREQRRKAGE